MHYFTAMQPQKTNHLIAMNYLLVCYPLRCLLRFQKLTKFEESIGIKFTHIRLLARAFTDRSIGYTNLTLGSNQRLEFLGDTVLQLIVSEYLYKFFPEHHEGHLSVSEIIFKLMYRLSWRI